MDLKDKRGLMLDSPLIRKLIKLTVEEDLSQGDITSELALPKNLKGRGRFVAKEALVVCGMPVVAMLIEELKSGVMLRPLVPEGHQVKSGSVIAEAKGKLADLLALERSALNFLQRLSGVATYTRAVIEQARGISLLDTRKTIPGHRLLDKYAVRIGGAKNHRFSLGDMILVKNNHIDANKGDVKKTLQRVYRSKPPYMPVEVEVRNMKELKAALAFKPQIIMLDNMDDATIKSAVKVAKKISSRTLIEVSGGVLAERLPRLAHLGVTLVSMGALTNKATAVDISLKISLKGRNG